MKKKYMALLLTLCMVFSMLPAMTVTATATGTVSDFEGEGFSLSTSGAYPWEVAEKDGREVLAATHGANKHTLSTLAVTFSESGVFSFEYSTSTTEGQGVLYYSFSLIENSTDYKNASNFSSVTDFSGTHDWTTVPVNVSAGQTLYFVYAKKAEGTNNENVWLRNLVLATDSFTVSASSSDDTYGTVSKSADSVAADAEDKSVTLTATPLNSGRFYGWVENGNFLSAENPYTVEVQANRNITAVFGTASQYEARVDGAFYTSVAEAIAAANYGTKASPAYVVLSNNATIKNDVSLSPYTVFVLPYSDLNATVDLDEETSDRPYSNSTEASPASGALTPQGTSVTYTLTVDEGATLTIPATAVLAVGGIYSGGQRIGGQVCGAHSEIDVEGSLNVSGILSCNGYVYGNGRMNIADGTVYENFTVTDFNGGGVFVEDVTKGLFPFTTYTVMGIQCETSFDASSYLKAYCALYVSSNIMQIPVEVVGGSQALIQVNSGTAVMKYDASKCFTVNNAKIGTLNIKINGDAAIGSMKLRLGTLAFDTKEFECPLPYCITIEQVSGKLDVTAKLKIMPGSELLIDKGATLNIGYGGSLNALLDNSAYENASSKSFKYPNMNSLMTNGYFPIAEVAVAGTLTAEDGSGIGGLIMVLDGGTVQVSKYADTESLNSMNMLMSIDEDVLTVGSDGFNKLMYTFNQAMNGDSSAYAAIMQRATVIDGGNTYVSENGSIDDSEYEEQTYTDTITFVDADYLDYVNEHGNANGYDVLATVTQERHTTLTYPNEAPAKNSEDYGYNYNEHPFLGWARVVTNMLGQLQTEMDDNNETIVYTTLPDVDGDAVYMAVYGSEWIYYDYTFTFEDGVADEEIAVPDATTVTNGYIRYSDIAAPTRAGYTFTGWKLDSDQYNYVWSSGLVNTSTLYYSYGSLLPAAPVNWIAQWTVNTYTVAFNANGGEGEMATRSIAYKTALPTNTFTNSERVFVGWNTHIDGTGTAYADGALFTGLTDVTLYAQWEEPPRQASPFDALWRDGEPSSTYITDYSFTTSEAFPWTYDAEKSSAASPNMTKNGEISSITMHVSAAKPMWLNYKQEVAFKSSGWKDFHWKVTVNGVETTIVYGNAYGGFDESSFKESKVSLPAGDYDVVWTFDSVDRDGFSYAYLSDFYLSEIEGGRELTLGGENWTHLNISYSVSGISSITNTPYTGSITDLYETDVVTLTVTPERGYQLSQWNDSNGYWKSSALAYSVTIGSDNVTLYPVEGQLAKDLYLTLHVPEAATAVKYTVKPFQRAAEAEKTLGADGKITDLYEKDQVEITVCLPGSADDYVASWYTDADFTEGTWNLSGLNPTITSMSQWNNGEYYLKAVYNGLTPIPGYQIADGIQSVTTRGWCVWTLEEDGTLKSGRETTGSGLSVLNITAAEDGYLSFDYKTSSTSMWNDAFYYTTDGNEINNNNLWDYSQITGTNDWTNVMIPVTKGQLVSIAYSTYYASEWGEGDPDATAWVRNITAYYGDANVTVMSSNEELGTVSVTGLTGNGQIATGGIITLSSTVSDSGQFVGWYLDTGKGMELISAEAACTYQVISNAKIVGRFGPKLTGTAVAGLNKAKFGDLETAFVYAVDGDIVVLLKDYTQTKSITVPAGVTLLVPYSDSVTANHSTAPDFDSNAYAKPSAFRTLTISSNVTLTVNGTLVVDAKLAAKGQSDGHNGTPSTAYGRVLAEQGSTIEVENGGTLTVWGYITAESADKVTEWNNSGGASVSVKSGGTLREAFQIRDWRGGNYTWSIVDTDVFPFSQYYVQNIEVPLVMYQGSVEKVTSAVYAAGSTQPLSDLVFVGNDGMFNVTNGYLRRSYDANTDQMVYDVFGNLRVQDISFSVYGIPVSSTSFLLPINSNISINVHEGTTDILAAQKILFLPGTVVTVDEGATLSLPNQNYIFAAAEWPSNAVYSGVKLRQLDYVAVKNGAPVTRNANTDAKFDVNGTVRVGGALYTTTSGANITSSQGTGNIQLVSAAPKNGSIEQSSAGSANLTINVTPAQLLNADGTYTQTAGASEGTAFYYANGTWATGFTLNYDANAGEEEITVPETRTYSFDGSASFTVAEALTRSGYTFTGWNTVATPTEDNPGTAYPAGQQVTVTQSLGASLTLYAQWEEITGYTVTVENITGTTPAATVSGLDGKVKADDTFTVSCANACVVAWTTDGTTYTRIPATATENANTYQFTLPNEISIENFKIVVAIKGDVNGDGTLDRFDVPVLQKGTLNSVLPKYEALSVLGALAGDVNGDGEVDRFDVPVLQKGTLNTKLPGYESIVW